MSNQPTPEPVLNHRQQKSIMLAKRIYAEFRWNMKKMNQATWTDIITLTDTCIRLAGDLIPDETIRRQTIAQFKAAKAKVQRLALTESKANIAKLTGEACVRCGVEFAVDAPKTWVADGEFVCARCQ